MKWEKAHALLHHWFSTHRFIVFVPSFWIFCSLFSNSRGLPSPASAHPRLVVLLRKRVKTAPWHRMSSTITLSGKLCCIGCKVRIRILRIPRCRPSRSATLESGQTVFVNHATRDWFTATRSGLGSIEKLGQCMVETQKLEEMKHWPWMPMVNNPSKPQNNERIMLLRDQIYLDAEKLPTPCLSANATAQAALDSLHV